MISKKVPAAAALFIGAILGALTAIIFQPNLIMTLSTLGEGASFAMMAFQTSIQAMALDTQIITGSELADALLNSSGMAGMLNTVWLILCATIFGSIMQATGMLQSITNAILKGVGTTFSLVARSVGTCLAFNVLASDQYLAIIVPGNMLKDAYEEQGLAPENLSRTLEDSGTVTSVLIPWNTCGVAQSGILGISTWTYLPYCIFNWISPIMTLIVAATGFKIRSLTEAKKTIPTVSH
jgi:NhaC family Na+:H+ antiporter